MHTVYTIFKINVHLINVGNNEIVLLSQGTLLRSSLLSSFSKRDLHNIAKIWLKVDFTLWKNDIKECSSSKFMNIQTFLLAAQAEIQVAIDVLHYLVINVISAINYEKQVKHFAINQNTWLC